jgi:tRNA U34 2-thiouridine synthase MnmA/TrmU
VADGLEIAFAIPQRRVAPGQTVALYDPAAPDDVLGSGVVA